MKAKAQPTREETCMNNIELDEEHWFKWASGCHMRGSLESGNNDFLVLDFALGLGLGLLGNKVEWHGK